MMQVQAVKIVVGNNVSLATLDRSLNGGSDVIDGHRVDRHSE
jgi:hypothetical protein